MLMESKVKLHEQCQRGIKGGIVLVRRILFTGGQSLGKMKEIVPFAWSVVQRFMEVRPAEPEKTDTEERLEAF